MIYPDVSLEEWLKKHPGLDISPEECIDCGAIAELTRPYITRVSVGIAAAPCKCGNQCPVRTVRVTDSRRAKQWASLFGGAE